MIEQRTIKYPVKSTGIGLHSGKLTNITILPAEVDSGIIFKRVDVEPNVLIPAKRENVTKTLLSTTIGVGDVSVNTVEHLLSVLYGFGIDNALIEIDEAEVPTMDGSSSSFVFLIQSAGILKQNKAKKIIVIDKELSVTMPDKNITITPFEGFCVDFTIDFDHKVVKEMPNNYVYNHSTTSFIYEISRARTFGFKKDIEYLQKNNLALGGSLDNATVIDDDSVLNEGGLRFSSEIVRHKILDTIGDLYLLGHAIIGKVKSHRSGHQLNSKLLQEIINNPDSWHFEELTDINKETQAIKDTFC